MSSRRILKILIPVLVGVVFLVAAAASFNRNDSLPALFYLAGGLVFLIAAGLRARRPDRTD